MTIRYFGWPVLAICLGAIGCGSSAEIETYVVPKEVARTAAPSAAPVSVSNAAATDRMLAAILPEGDRAWFFKVTGPTAEVDSRADEIGKFFESVRLAPGKPHPDWQLPAGWQEQPASAMRAATLLIPAGGKPLELSVSVLPWQGPAAMLGNVNRWRGQLQLSPIEEAGLAKSTRELKAGDATMTVVDLSGRMTGGMMGGMTPPFAGGAMPSSAPPTSTSPPSGTATALPPGHPAVGAPAAANTAPFKIEAPKGWQARPAMGMRKAEFLIDDGGKSAVMTAIDFPASAGPMMADPVANLNRWRLEVGLPELAPDAARQAIETLKIDGGDAMLMTAIPDAKEPSQSQASRGTIAAMLRRGDTIWFFKLLGDRDLVARERENFQTMLKSVRFSGDGGASDGNQ
jgi:hypothetical protein